jgi:hypothetical protein
MGPKKQGFWPRIICSQLKLPDFESPSCQFWTLKMNFLFQKQSESFQKKTFIEEYQFRHTFF